MGAEPLRHPAHAVWRATLLVFLVAAAHPTPGLAQPGGEEYENLQVLPEDLSEAELRAIMSGFSEALGVNCMHCHVRAPGQRPDFAADDKPAKETARAMIRMVRVINGEHLTDLPTVEGAVLGVSCMTCHRGLTNPQTLDHLLAQYVPAHGLEASFAKYDSLRTAYYGTAAYDFSEAAFIRLARRLMAAEAASDALAFLERNLELYPASVETHVTMAEVHLQRNDPAAAIASLERALELEPDNGRLQRQLEELRGQQ